MMQQGTCSTTGRTPTGQNTYLTLVRFWSKKWDWTWKNPNPGSWWWSGWKNELGKIQIQGVPATDLGEPGGARQDEDTASPRWQRGLRSFISCTISLLFSCDKCSWLLNAAFQKILEMDCLIDQLGQSKKAKQGPLKVFILSLKTFGERMFPIEMEAVESFWVLKPDDGRLLRRGWKREATAQMSSPATTRPTIGWWTETPPFQ